jgi:outer membrane receptor protein involved in Fe transport
MQMRVPTLGTFKAGLAMFALLVWLIVAPARMQAQVAGASLSGTVSDASGAALAAAKVTIENLATGVSRETTTDKDGFYTAPNLLPGTYEIAVSAAGFSTQVQKGITLTVGGQSTVNLAMRVGAVSERVEVTEEAPVVQTSSSDISAVVNSTTVRELPLNGRSWTDLSNLQPGVTRVESAFNAAAGADRGERGFGAQISISGGKPVQNNYRLDGVSVVDFANGAPGSVLGVSLGVDAIQEFSVITTNYSADYGRTSGGVVNAITRSGTNAFHGSAFEFLRNSALDGRGYFDVDPDGKPIKSPFRRNQFGGSAGGPIVKDRTFIFGDYEGIRQSKGVSQRVPVPSDKAREGIMAVGPPITVDPAATAYLAFWPKAPASAQSGDTGQFAFAGQQITHEDFFTVRADHKFSDRDSIFGTFFRDDATFSTPDGLDQVLNGHHINRKAVIIEETHSFSNALLNSVRFGYSVVGAFDNNGISAIDPLAADKSFASTPGMNATRVNIAGYQSFNGGVGSLDHFLNDWKSFQVYDDAFFTHKTHSIKFGVAVERLHNGVTSFGNAAGNWNFTSLSNFLQNIPDAFSSALGAATPRNVRQTIFGVYIQDDWRLRTNLTLNVGLRYEMATVPTETNGKFSSLHNLTDSQPYCGVANAFCKGVAPLFSNPTLHNFEPRVGLVWDPFRNGKTVVRAGAGMFDVLPLPYQFVFLQYRPAPFYLLGGTNTFPSKSFYNSAESADGIFSLYNKLATDQSRLSATFIDPHPHRNYVMQWNMNVQRQITTNLAALVGFVGSHGVHQQFRVDDANMTLPTLTQYGWLFPTEPVVGTNPVFNPSFGGGIRSLWWNANSSYNALVTSVTKRMNHGVQMQGSFTWGKSLDNNSAGVGADSFGNSLSSLHWYDYRLTKAVSDYNIGKTLSLSTTWQVPGPKSSGAASWLLGGWELGGIFTAHDGMPVTPLTGVNYQNSQDPFAFPDRLTGSGCKSLVNPGNVNNYIKTQCFSMPTLPSTAAGQAFYNASCDQSLIKGTNTVMFPFPICANLRGNAGRNIIIGPGLLNLDFSVFKNMPVRRISEKFNIQFRAEFFNVANHPSFQAPANSNLLFDGTGLPVGGAGSLGSTVTDSRDIQFALKFVW